MVSCTHPASCNLPIKPLAARQHPPNVSIISTVTESHKEQPSPDCDDDDLYEICGSATGVYMYMHIRLGVTFTF